PIIPARIAAMTVTSQTHRDLNSMSAPSPQLAAYDRIIPRIRLVSDYNGLLKIFSPVTNTQQLGMLQAEPHAPLPSPLVGEGRRPASRGGVRGRAGDQRRVRSPPGSHNKRPLTPTLSISASKTRVNALMARSRLWRGKRCARGEREHTEFAAIAVLYPTGM